jgi:hypothetical protein
MPKEGKLIKGVGTTGVGCTAIYTGHPLGGSLPDKEG